MSLPYPGSHRSSWCLGYVPAPSSTSSLSSRPRSSYGISSATGRLDYSSPSYGSLGRHDKTSSTTYASTSRRNEIYSPVSSISTRSSSRLGDSGSRRHIDVGSLSHVSSRSGQDVGGRRDSSYSDAPPTSSLDVSGTSEHVSRIRNASHIYGSYGSSRNKDVGDVSSSFSSDVSSRKKNSDETTLSASTGHAYSDRNRERMRDIQERDIHPEIHEDKDISRVRGLRRQSSGEGGKKEDKSVNIQNTNPCQLETTNILYTKSSKDGEDETKPVFQKNDCNNKAAVTDDDGVYIEDSSDRRNRSSHSLSQSNLDVKHHTRLNIPNNSRFSAQITKSVESSGLVQNESYQQNATFGVSAEPSEVSHRFRNTSSTKTFSEPHLSGMEDDIREKSGTIIETCECQRNSRERQCEDHSRKPRVNGTAKVSTNNARTSNIITTNVSQAEIIRLESLCEARTKELTHTKMELRTACQAFDAMAALVNYCCVDLNAFECIPLAKKLDTLQQQLTECLSVIADLNSQKDALEKSLAQIMLEKEDVTRRAQEACDTVEKEREEHSRITHEMDDTHNAALTAQRDELTSKHDENINKFNQFYDRQIDLLRLAHDRQMSDMKNESKLEMNALKISHLEEIQELRNKHDSQMEELHKQHRNKLEDITHRFESIKLTLSEKVESLRGECDDLARRARSSEDALQRDADAKVQIALAPFLTLPKEIESLKMVLEMRNEEIQKLRTKNMDVEKQLEEIPISREKIISLQQKVENLEAIINIKTDHEKQLHEKCQILMRKYDRESRANKRLSMDYEQVVWRMSQSSEFGSCESLTKRNFSRSPPHSKEGSPDGRRRAVSPNSSQSDVVLRVKKRSSHSISEGDRQLRSRSATFVVEKSESSSSHSPSMSPQLKQKRWRKKSQAEEIAAESGNLDRMCHSAGAEIMSDLPGQQKQREHKNKITLKDINGLHGMSSDDMANSYARSLSGVSDSGMYDSMTKSDVLDSSIVSTDSEWGTSVNLSMNCDSTMDELESGPVAGEFHSLNDVTVIDTKMSFSNTDMGNIIFSNISNVSSSSPHSSSECQIEDDQQGNSYQVYVTLPQGPGVATDSVLFNDRANLDSC